MTPDDERDRVVVVGQVLVEQPEQLGEDQRGVGLASHRARRTGEQACPQPLDQDLGLDPTGVAVAGEEAGHALGADRGGGLRGWIVSDERQRDLSVERGDQPGWGWVV